MARFGCGILTRGIALAGVGGVVLGCGETLPPFAEAVVVVDTDAPARMVEELRIDVYTSDGRWIESKPLRLLDPRDWPTSFSVVAPTEGESTDVLLRVRAHPTGRYRDYLGERFRERPVFEPIPVAESVQQGCSDAALLEMGKTRWVRGGRTKFIDGLTTGGNCHQWPTETGAGVVRVEIAEAGAYRFAALTTMPPGDAQISLQLRRACEDDASALACEAGLEWTGWPPGPDDYPAPTEGAIAGYLPRMDVIIDQPGTYYLWATNGGTELGGNLAPWSAQLAATRLDEWADLEPAVDDPPWNYRDESSAPAQRLTLEGGETPSREPAPQVTIDRLVRLALRYGEQQTVKVTLHGACFGTMAKLRDDPEQQAPVLGEATTCVDEENVRVAVDTPPSEAAEGSRASAVGSFPAPEPCPAAAVTEDKVCVPGGMFLFGAEVGGALSIEQVRTAQPERPAVVSPFWIDRREVSVERWREALADGFEPPHAQDGPYVNDEPYLETDDPTDPRAQNEAYRQCTYSSEAMGREDWPVNCLGWFGARAFCQYYGGDLPTEVQWEYVATAAGRELETAYPWGDDQPACSLSRCEGDEECHVVTVNRSAIASECLDQGFGPSPVHALEDPRHGDVSVPLNAAEGSTVFGLAGNVGEFMRDGFHPYDSPCWLGAPLRDPSCEEREAPVRSRRGGHFTGQLLSAAGANRGWVRGSARPRDYGIFPTPLHVVGFRCVYPYASEAP